MFSTGFKGVGLHYTAFATAICGDSRPTAASHGVSRRKKFAAKANVESRVKERLEQGMTIAVAALERGADNDYSRM